MALQGDHNTGSMYSFKGLYRITPLVVSATFTTNVVMLTQANDVQILGNCHLLAYTSGRKFAQLPSACCPIEKEYFPVVVLVNDVPSVVPCIVDTDGSISLYGTFSNCVVMLSAINFNISDKYYV